MSRLLSVEKLRYGHSNDTSFSRLAEAAKIQDEIRQHDQNTFKNGPPGARGRQLVHKNPVTKPEVMSIGSIRSDLIAELLQIGSMY